MLSEERKQQQEGSPEAAHELRTGSHSPESAEMPNVPQCEMVEERMVACMTGRFLVLISACIAERELSEAHPTCSSTACCLPHSTAFTDAALPFAAPSCCMRVAALSNVPASRTPSRTDLVTVQPRRSTDRAPPYAETPWE